MLKEAFSFKEQGPPSRQLCSHPPVTEIEQGSHRLGRGRLDGWRSGRDNDGRASLLLPVSTRHGETDNHLAEAEPDLTAFLALVWDTKAKNTHTFTNQGDVGLMQKTARRFCSAGVGVRLLVALQELVGVQGGCSCTDLSS